MYVCLQGAGTGSKTALRTKTAGPVCGQAGLSSVVLINNADLKFVQVFPVSPVCDQISLVTCRVLLAQLLGPGGLLCDS